MPILEPKHSVFIGLPILYIEQGFGHVLLPMEISVLCNQRLTIPMS